MFLATSTKRNLRSLMACLALLCGCTSDNKRSQSESSSAIVVTATDPIEFFSGGTVGTIGFDSDHCVLLKEDPEDLGGEVAVWPRSTTVDEDAGTIEIAPGTVVQAGNYYMFGGGFVSVDSAAISTNLNSAAARCFEKAGDAVFLAVGAEECTPSLCPGIALP